MVEIYARQKVIKWKEGSCRHAGLKGFIWENRAREKDSKRREDNRRHACS